MTSMTSMPQESAEIFKQDTKGGFEFPGRDVKSCWMNTNETVAAHAKFASYAGSNIRRWPTGFKSGANEKGSRNL